MCLLQIADHEFGGLLFADDGGDFVCWGNTQGGAKDETEVCFFGVRVGG